MTTEENKATTEASPATESDLVLIDLSSIAHPIWHMAQSDPDPNKASQQIVARVRALAQGHPHVAICCDSGRSFRHDVAPSYKANRPAAEAPLHHQIALAKETLAGDGFPIWAVRGFEADDLIASATTKALEAPSLTVLIVSADKDLLQLVGPRVNAKSVRDGSVLDADAVVAKLGVTPGQVRDYLCLVGDASDNVKGAVGIGPKKAASLLATFGSLDALYSEMDAGNAALQPSVAASLKDFRQHLETTRALITLRCDVEIPFEEVIAERVPKDVATFAMEDEDMESEQVQQEPPAAETAPAALALTPAQNAGFSGPSDILAPAPAEWERQLEPRSMKETIALAKYVFESRLFSAYGTPQAVMTTLLAGRELGLQSMASLRALHIVEGRPTLAADLIRALVIRSGAAKFFRCTERSATRATFETQRGDDPPLSLTYTIEEATAAGVVKPKSGWVTNPADMLVARASSKLARLVYPDVVHGVYTPEEMYEARDAQAA